MAEGPKCKQKNARPLEAQVQLPSLCRPKQVNEDDEYEYILSVETGSRRIGAHSAAYCRGHCVGLGGDKVGVQILSKSVRGFLA